MCDNILLKNIYITKLPSIKHLHDNGYLPSNNMMDGYYIIKFNIYSIYYIQVSNNHSYTYCEFQFRASYSPIISNTCDFKPTIRIKRVQNIL